MCEPGLDLTFKWVLYQARLPGAVTESCRAPGSQPDRLWPFALDPPSDGAEPPKAGLGEVLRC